VIVRKHTDGALPGGASRTGLPVPARTALVAVATAAVVGLVGGHNGFWFAVPAALLAASACVTVGGVAWSAAIVLGVAAAVLSVAHTGSVPPLWAALLVPVASVAVQWNGRRQLTRDRAELRRAAMTDPLTGLVNRRVLWERAEYEIVRHRRAGSNLVVVMLDLDGFKALNDRHGHAAGDRMLCMVADSLTAALREQDTVARLGGDEFCVIAPETDEPVELARRVSAAVRSATDGYTSLRGSIGLAVFPDDGNSIERLLRVADDRLLQAKRRLPAARQRRAA
jgi:diguanylate cyclase (GGDEF)-like protein